MKWFFIFFAALALHAAGDPQDLAKDLSTLKEGCAQFEPHLHDLQKTWSDDKTGKFKKALPHLQQMIKDFKACEAAVGTAGSAYHQALKGSGDQRQTDLKDALEHLKQGQAELKKLQDDAGPAEDWPAEGKDAMLGTLWQLVVTEAVYGEVVGELEQMIAEAAGAKSAK